ncbi:unnamed protein product [Schistosoma margrebowiei]|uniref:CCHC-type domain-containing protein n=1 Tax=Schistosoma margrebowiei TaxID=48269 RepID=A0AA84ZQ75_9TREM|nr:unnamed protein product [Schistosoma margrebowiei]
MGTNTRNKKNKEAHMDGLSSEELEYLNKNHIEPLKTKRRCGLLCNVCGMVMSTVAAAIHHTSSNSHNVNLMTAELKTTLLYLPPITDSHRTALDSELKSAFLSVVADTCEMQRRQNFANDLIAAIEARIPNIKVRGTGSSWFGLALPDSHCSLDVICSNDFDENKLLAMDPTMDDDGEDNDGDEEGDDNDVHDDDDDDDDDNDQSIPQPICGQSTNDTEQSMGIGYVLSNIFDLLQLNACDSPTNTPHIQTISEKATSFNCSTDHNTKMNELSDKPNFPKFHTVLRTSGDYFYLSLTDFCGVRYRISTGNPYGYDLAKLINTYLNLNNQARQLAILFRKLSRLGHLDMPENGTFEETVIPLLVIFYLQHCEPPSLPNLHMLYRQHLHEIPENSYHQVLPPNTDCSFITDIELIRKLCPDQPYSSSSNNLPCLADLWLGFLRFYLFDFKTSSCTINIVEPEPVSCFNASEKRCFTVTDPFNPKHNLCRNLTQVSRDYINSQLLAAYGYFGVPRLATNGRHLFTHISVVEKSPDEPKDACDKLDQNTSSSISQTTMSNDKMTASAGIHLTPIIDDSDNFESNLNKVTNLITEKFQLLSNGATIKHSVLPSTGEDILESSSTIDHTALDNSMAEQKALSFSEMFSYILTYVMDELFESNIVPDLVSGCLKMSEKRFFIPVSSSFKLSLNDFIQITRNFAYDYWLSFFNTYISKGKFSASKRIITKTTLSLFSKSVKLWLDRLKLQNVIDNDTSIDSPCGQSQKMNCSDENVFEDQCNHQMNQDSSSLSKSIEDDYSEPIVRQSKNNFLDVDEYSNFEEVSHLQEVDNPYDICMTVSDDAFLDCNLENDFNDSEIYERLECTLDVDYNDDIIDPISTSSSFVDKNSELLETLTSQGNNQNRIKSSNTNNLTSNDSHPVNHLSSISCPSNELVTASNELTRRDNKLTKNARKSEKKQQGHSNSMLNSNSNTTASKFSPTKSKKKKSAKKLEWEDVISSRSAVAPPIDDDRPDYYNSKLLENLQPEDFDFQFVSNMNLSSNRRHNQSSVLGLASRNQPSTLLAHFDAPQPQCQACNLTGHRQSQCETTSDKSVSFLAWHKLLNKTPWPPIAEQIKNLTYCLNCLEEHHETYNKVNARQELVKKIHQCFSYRFPSVQLELFGSCANGFDLQTSDLDVCVFFPVGSTEWNYLKDKNSTNMLIRQFKKQLSYCRNRLNITHIQPILTARVPILKVSFSNTFEADISFSNYLALSNTRMLAFYTKIEPKLRTLGIALKTVTKITKIGRAAAGGISSYAWIIMLIHYLQQIDQLPVLQELYEGSTKPTNLVNGWNVWYQNDLSVINRLWKPANPSQSVGEMWLGFLRYYLFEFNRDKYVVTIRQKKLLIRFVKMWRSLFAIEDPFNLNHNLTAGLSHSMFLYILTVFHTVLVHHTTFLPKQMSINQWCYHLFSPEYIVVDKRFLKNNMLCFICNQTGHGAFECPRNKKRNKRDNSDIVTLHSLIGHFLQKTQASQSNSQEPMGQHYDNSNQNRQLNSTSAVCQNFPKPNYTPTNISSHTYRNPFKPQNSYQVRPIRNNLQQQPITSNYRHVQPHHVNMRTNSHSILPSVPNPTPLLPNNTVGSIPNYAFVLNSLSNHLVQSNIYGRQQSFPPSCYSSPVGYVNNQQQYRNTVQANHPVNYRPKSQQNNNNTNEPKKYHKSSRVSSSSVYEEQFSSVSSDHSIVVTSNKSPCEPKKYDNKQNVSNPHQTNDLSRKSHYHNSNYNDPGINNNYTSKSTLSSSGNQTKSCSTTPYRQKQSDSPLKAKSNFQQSLQKQKYSISNGSVIDSHEKRKYSVTESNKVNSAFRGSRNCQRFGRPNKAQLSNNDDNNSHLLDENLVKRLHNMSTTSSSSQNSNNKY